MSKGPTPILFPGVAVDLDVGTLPGIPIPSDILAKIAEVKLIANITYPTTGKELIPGGLKIDLPFLPPILSNPPPALDNSLFSVYLPPTLPLLNIPNTLLQKTNPKALSITFQQKIPLLEFPLRYSTLFQLRLPLMNITTSSFRLKVSLANAGLLAAMNLDLDDNYNTTSHVAFDSVVNVRNATSSTSLLPLPDDSEADDSPLGGILDGLLQQQYVDINFTSPWIYDIYGGDLLVKLEISDTTSPITISSPLIPTLEQCSSFYFDGFFKKPLPCTPLNMQYVLSFSDFFD